MRIVRRILKFWDFNYIKSLNDQYKTDIYCKMVENYRVKKNSELNIPFLSLSALVVITILFVWWAYLREGSSYESDRDWGVVGLLIVFLGFCLYNKLFMISIHLILLVRALRLRGRSSRQ